MAMNKDDVLVQLDHPFFFVALGITPFVLGFAGLLLWGFKNSSFGNGAARLIQGR
jgi:hypothetical protein